MTYGESRSPNDTWKTFVINATHSRRRKRTIENETFSFNLNDLKTYTTYTITVLAFTVKDGVPTLAANFTTAQDGMTRYDFTKYMMSTYILNGLACIKMLEWSPCISNLSHVPGCGLVSEYHCNFTLDVSNLNHVPRRGLVSVYYCNFTLDISNLSHVPRRGIVPVCHCNFLSPGIPNHFCWSPENSR